MFSGGFGLGFGCLGDFFVCLWWGFLCVCVFLCVVGLFVCGLFVCLEFFTLRRIELIKREKKGALLSRDENFGK